MRFLLLPVLLAPTRQAHVRACVIHSQGERWEVLRQQSRNIPPELFRSDFFCQPQLGQKVMVIFVERCLGAAFGICRGVQVSNAVSPGYPSLVRDSSSRPV